MSTATHAHDSGAWTGRSGRGVARRSAASISLAIHRARKALNASGAACSRREAVTRAVMPAPARAAIITRGLAEVTRLAVQMGGDPMTMLGLAGAGDLVLTCTGDLSRNRRVGLALGQGKKLSQVLQELGEVAEGVNTAKSGRDLGAKVGVELPITEKVYEVLHEDKPAAIGMMQLLARSRKSERAFY